MPEIEKRITEEENESKPVKPPESTALLLETDEKEGEDFNFSDQIKTDEIKEFDTPAIASEIPEKQNIAVEQKEDLPVEKEFVRPEATPETDALIDSVFLGIDKKRRTQEFEKKEKELEEEIRQKELKEREQRKKELEDLNFEPTEIKTPLPKIRAKTADEELNEADKEEEKRKAEKEKKPPITKEIKKVEDPKKITIKQIGLVMLILFAGIGFFTTAYIKMPSKSEKIKKEEESPRIDLKEYKTDNFRKTREQRRGIEVPTDYSQPPQGEQPPTAEKQTPQPQQPMASTQRGTPTQIKRGSNYQKDRDIISQYEKINPNAAAGGEAGGVVPGDGPKEGEDIAEYYQKRRTTKTLHSVNIKDTKTESEGKGKPTLALQNIKVRAKLTRSLSTSTKAEAKAEILEDAPSLPAGSLCFGNISGTNNNRAEITFSRCIVGGTTYTVSGTATQNNIVGVVGKVETVADKNLGSNAISAGASVAGKLIDKATGGLTSDLTTAQKSDVQKDQDAKKKEIILTIAPGASFTIDFD